MDILYILFQYIKLYNFIIKLAIQYLHVTVRHPFGSCDAWLIN